MTAELLDELEAGELSVEFEGEEPQDVLEWAIERFAPRLAISTAFQADDVALIDMAYGIDPAVRVFTVDTGRLPEETHELIEQLRDRYPGLRLDAAPARRRAGAALVAANGLDLMKRVGREPAALLQRPQGAAADEAPRRPRRVGHRPAPRPVGDADEHPQGRDRPRPRRDREAQPARRVDEGRGLGLPAARTTCPTHALYAQGYTSIGCAPCTRAIAPGRGRPRRPLVVGDRTRRRSAACTARSSTAASSTSCTRSSARTATEQRDVIARPRRGGRGRARRGAGRARAGAGRRAARPARRPRRGGRRRASSATTRRRRSRSCSSSASDGPDPQRLRARGRAGGAQALPPAARRGASSRESAREVTEALACARGEAARSAISLAVGGARRVPVSVARRRARADASSSTAPARASSPSGSDGRAALLHGVPRPRRARSCLVVGAGPVALEKVDGLLDCGARVTVVAPGSPRGSARCRSRCVRREYRASDLDGRSARRRRDRRSPR